MSLFVAKSSRRGTVAEYTPTLTDGSRRPQSQVAPKWDDLSREAARKAERVAALPMAPVARPFRLGDKVKHEKFGAGTVINFEGDSLVTIAFPAPVGIKKLDMGFAKLEKA
jgi:hypothetical protein